MINNPFLKEIAYELFTFEWKEYIKEFDSGVNDLISNSYLLIPINLIDDIKGIKSFLNYI